MLEAGMTVVLFSRIIRTPEGKNEYGFETQATYSTAKSPEECFKDLIIPNDLKLVETAVRNFYKLDEPQKEEEKNGTNKNTNNIMEV